jgi:hypothetical protein
MGFDGFFKMDSTLLDPRFGNSHLFGTAAFPTSFWRVDRDDSRPHRGK